MRVLHVINSMRRSGAERHLANILEPLAALGVENHLVTLVSGNAFEPQVTPWTSRSEFAVEDRLGPLTIPHLASLAREVDLVHTQLTRSDVFGRAAAALAGRPSVTTLQVARYTPLEADALPLPRRLRTSLEKVIERATMRPSCRFIAVSNAARDAYVRHVHFDPNLIEVIPNSVDLRAFDPSVRDDRDALRAKFGFDPNTFCVVMVARFESQKAHEVAIRAVTAAAREAPVHLYFAGHGSTEASMRALAASISAPVTFLGLCEDVVSLLGAADLFLLPSRFEGMPLALIEALAAGTPSLCSDIPENLETAGPAAEYFPVDDEAALTRSFLQLRANDDHRRDLGERGRVRVADYDARRVAARVARVFTEALRS